jgi:hypothetical protein
MAVDVETQVVIDRPRAEVAAFAADPDNAMAWYWNIRRVVWRTPKPLVVGTRIGFFSQFLGKDFEYVYEVTSLTPGEQLVMSMSEGPFPMETTYLWRDEPGGGTRMSLRNHGKPRGFGRVGAPLVRRAIRKENAKDLERLKALLETRS